MRFSGFSLLEVSLALFVSGLLGSFFLSFATSFHAMEAKKCQEQRTQHILRALSFFAAQKGRLPWASRPALSGKEDQNRLEGRLPYAALNLSERYEKNHKGVPLVYQVARLQKRTLVTSPLQCFCTSRCASPLREGGEGQDFFVLRLGQESMGDLFLTRNQLMAFYGGISCLPYQVSPPKERRRPYGR